MEESVSPLPSTGVLLARCAGNEVLRYISWCVFAILDIVDQLLCPLFALLDSFLDSETTVCYCRSKNQRDHQAATFRKEVKGSSFIGDGGQLESWTRSSDTLYAPVRRSDRTRFHLLTLHRTLSSEQTIESATFNNGGEKKLSGAKTLGPVIEGHDFSKCADVTTTTHSHLKNLTEQSVDSLSRRKIKQAARWSDCACQRCTSWQSDQDQLLHVHVDDRDVVASVGREINVSSSENNVIFLHGFLSSSSFWTDTVLPALPESVRSTHRLFAVDILGFGRSPKPSNSLYTIADHIDMIRRSVLERHGIQSFHLVAHSMGCTIALALAAHYSSALKSITLIAPPYFPAIPGSSSSTHLMQQVAARRIWPLMTFGASVMSWYEHIGRVVCLVVCKHHRFWEPFLYFVHSKLHGKRVPSSCVTDFTRHTHHSAWHIFHNTICSGGYAADHCLQVLLEAGRRVRVIHGTRDAVIPFSGSVSLSQRFPNVRLTAVAAANHGTVVFGRELELADELAEVIQDCVQH